MNDDKPDPSPLASKIGKLLDESRAARAERADEIATPLSAFPVATGSLARLEAEIEHFFATATHEEIETLLKKADFDHYNKIGTDILSPRKAPENNKLTDAPNKGPSPER